MYEYYLNGLNEVDKDFPAEYVGKTSVQFANPLSKGDMIHINGELLGAVAWVNQHAVFADQEARSTAMIELEFDLFQNNGRIITSLESIITPYHKPE